MIMEAKDWVNSIHYYSMDDNSKKDGYSKINYSTESSSSSQSLTHPGPVLSSQHSSILLPEPLTLTVQVFLNLLLHIN